MYTRRKSRIQMCFVERVPITVLGPQLHQADAACCTAMQCNAMPCLMAGRVGGLPSPSQIRSSQSALEMWVTGGCQRWFPSQVSACQFIFEWAWDRQFPLITLNIDIPHLANSISFVFAMQAIYQSGEVQCQGST